MNNNRLITSYTLVLCLLIASVPNRTHPDQFTRSCSKLLLLTAIICGPLIWCQMKDMQADEQMLGLAQAALREINRDYGFVLDLFERDPEYFFNHFKNWPLIDAIPTVKAGLSSQETVLNNRLIRARTSRFVRQNAAMMQRIESTKEEVQALLERLCALQVAAALVSEQ